MTLLTKQELRSCSEGDSRALRKCIDSYGESIARIIGRILKNRDECDECYWRLMNKLPELIRRYDPSCTGENLGALLHVAAKRAALGIIRKRQTGVLACKNIVSDKVLETLSDHKTPESQYVKSEVDLMVNSALDSLDIQSEREILAFWYLYGYQTEEIARIFMIEPQSVKSKLARARKSFEKKFRELFPEAYEEFKI